ncbi:hypothetical protein [Aeromonas hydrophila]|uniref:hypothetical protein n=1 Tax=Aeromonas hydrophila TaxID=644 RepID=UPI001A8D63DB|nr:hypothetical protein [Aeromonas hydrophila]
MSALLNEMGQLSKLPLHKAKTPCTASPGIELTTWLGLYVPCPSHRHRQIITGQQRKSPTSKSAFKLGKWLRIDSRIPDAHPLGRL